MDRGAWWATVHGYKESDTTEVTWHICMHTHRDSYTHTHTHTHSSEMSVVTIPNEAPGEVLESR